MVYFTCSRCQETLKKKAAETHGCGGAHFSCVDCMQTFDRRTIKGHTSCLTEEQKFHGKFAKAKGQQQKQPNGCAQPTHEGSSGKRKLEALTSTEARGEENKASNKAPFPWKENIDAVLRRAPQKQLPWRRLVVEVIKIYRKERQGDVSDEDLMTECLANVPLSYTSENSSRVRLQ